MDELIVLFPDYRGEGFQGKFGQRLKELRGERKWKLISVLNGAPIEEFESLEKMARESGFRPVISLGKGLAKAFISGYQYIIDSFEGLPIVRIDTTEHDINMIEHLARRAVEIQGMVIGDLDFTGTPYLIEGSIDWFAHQYIWPELYRQLTDGKLAFSCAHGFQSFGSPVILEKILWEAKKIFWEIQREEGRLPSWGFDAMMALAALELKIPVKVASVKAIQLRNRPAKKIFSQFKTHLQIFRAFLRMKERNCLI